MEEESLMDPSSQQLLFYVGYLVARWNYAEYFARDILKPYAQGESIFAPEYIKLGRKKSREIENDLRTIALPLWACPGRPYLERLVDCYAVAREHRNHVVHGVYMELGSFGPHEAKAWMMPAMPVNGLPQAPSFLSASEIRTLADYFHDLAMFAREVAITFRQDGSVQPPDEGSSAARPFPAMISVLPKLEAVTIGP